ncbi:MAG: divalent-cation tolerance protein CutA [Pseudomonadota bacterium]|uniref:divalent-cation tolerance protein CutA n=1 Tax=Thermithiobacillus tepidarius TaxID=929 RepID=UPI00041043C0|nr:divalent-cation tolerance protein CutA [Thermithiobacillus tepidarius]
MPTSTDPHGPGNEAVYLVYCTCPTRAKAEEIALAAVRAGAAACAHLLPAGQSFYLWEGELQMAEELTLLFKSAAARYADLEALIRALHPYEVPEILAVPVAAGLPAYLDWVRASGQQSA